MLFVCGFLQHYWLCCCVFLLCKYFFVGSTINSCFLYRFWRVFNVAVSFSSCLLFNRNPNLQLIIIFLHLFCVWYNSKTEAWTWSNSMFVHIQYSLRFFFLARTETFRSIQKRITMDSFQIQWRQDKSKENTFSNQAKLFRSVEKSLSKPSTEMKCTFFSLSPENKTKDKQFAWTKRFICLHLVKCKWRHLLNKCTTVSMTMPVAIRLLPFSHLLRKYLRRARRYTHFIQHHIKCKQKHRLNALDREC